MAKPPKVLVVDSSIAVMASAAGRWHSRRGWRFIAPPLLWSEVTSALHEALWSRELDPDQALAGRRAFAGLPITPDHPDELREVAWAIADQLGLAKTYDAEFLALARIRECQLVTADAKLYRTASRTGLVVDPSALPQR